MHQPLDELPLVRLRGEPGAEHALERIEVLSLEAHLHEFRAAGRELDPGGIVLLLHLRRLGAHVPVLRIGAVLADKLEEPLVQP